jgi:hypothetical protein
MIAALRDVLSLFKKVYSILAEVSINDGSSEEHLQN